MREEPEDEWMVVECSRARVTSGRLVMFMQTKLEEIWPDNQLFFFIRLEVPPLNYSLEVDSWV